MMKMVENVNVGPWRLESPLLDLDRNDKIRPKQTFHKTLWIPDCGSLDFIQMADSIKLLWIGIGTQLWRSRPPAVFVFFISRCDLTLTAQHTALVKV